MNRETLCPERTPTTWPRPDHEGLFAEEMSPALDSLSLKYVIANRGSKLVSLDVGCGNGIATAAVLARGGYVMAIDADPARLHELLERVPREQYRRLEVRTSKLQDFDMKGAHFGTVHAARVLHLLSPAQLRAALRKFFRWLYPAGTLFVSAYSPEGTFWDAYRAEYEARVKRGEMWPGLIESGLMENGQPSGATADGLGSSLNLLDRHVLRRELANAGFAIDEISTYELEWDPQQVCCAVVAHCAG